MVFLMTHWRTILLIYAIIGGLVFLGVLLFFVYASYTDDEAEYCEDYYYPNHNKRNGGVIVSATLGLFIGVPCGLLWPFIPLLLFGVWALTAITEKFPRLLGNLADDEKVGDDNDE